MLEGGDTGIPAIRAIREESHGETSLSIGFEVLAAAVELGVGLAAEVAQSDRGEEP